MKNKKSKKFPIWIFLLGICSVVGLVGAVIGLIAQEKGKDFPNGLLITCLLIVLLGVIVFGGMLEGAIRTKEYHKSKARLDNIPLSSIEGVDLSCMKNRVREESKLNEYGYFIKIRSSTLYTMTTYAVKFMSIAEDDILQVVLEKELQTVWTKTDMLKGSNPYLLLFVIETETVTDTHKTTVRAFSSHFLADEQVSPGLVRGGCIPVLYEMSTGKLWYFTDKKKHPLLSYGRGLKLLLDLANPTT